MVKNCDLGLENISLYSRVLIKYHPKASFGNHFQGS